MANMMEKIGDKLHMGGHKKEEPHTVGAAHVPHYAAPPGYGAAWQRARETAIAARIGQGAIQEGAPPAERARAEGRRSLDKAERRGCATSAIYHSGQLASSDALCRPHGSRYCCSNYLQCLWFLWSQACNWYFTSQTLSQIFRKPFVRATVQIVSLHQGPRQDPMKKPPVEKDPEVDVPREGVEINQIYENSDAMHSSLKKESLTKTDIHSVCLPELSPPSIVVFYYDISKVIMSLKVPALYQAIKTTFSALRMGQPDAMTMIALIFGYSQHGCTTEFFEIFQGMLAKVEMGFDEDAIVGSALVDMYVKCGDILDACKVFSTMPGTKLPLWNSLTAGFSL
ncbi:hypothetical protein GOP47_0024837 [Adiantum capillus-veneris]|uniref:Pentatricopeptide repeat-containing protein n=1 Tax=Adiantum capillus-veneris TaxID=13818 RepID=A0A9D4U3I5_ADICA|nr:hypothetical protein GOP47_0024837 [Adiantum capillus-veneris]